MTATVYTTRPVTANDRLGITLFFAVVIHAVVILGISFDYNRDQSPPKDSLPSLEVTLVNTPTNDKPEQADYMAQSNQEGAGNTQERVRPQAPPEAMSEPIPTPGNASQMTPPQVQNADPRPAQTDAITVTKSETKIQTGDESPQQDSPEMTAAELVRKSMDMAKLEWELAEAKRVYAEKQDVRKKYLLPKSASAKEAAYLDAWQKKVELVGNTNYPEEAKRRKLSGTVLMMVEINADGSLADVQILRSSGHKVLDDAARRIVKMAAPYPPLTAELKEKYDVLQISRVWRFLDGNTLRTQASE
jgi:protein TonB